MSEVLRCPCKFTTAPLGASVKCVRCGYNFGSLAVKK